MSTWRSPMAPIPRTQREAEAHPDDWIAGPFNKPGRIRNWLYWTASLVIVSLALSAPWWAK